MKALQKLVQNSVKGVLSAYLGSLLTIVLFALIGGPERPSGIAVKHSVLDGALVVATFPIAAMLFGGTGVVLFLILANTCPRRNAPTALTFLALCAAAGFLGILVPLTTLWSHFPFEAPSLSEWRLYVFGSSVALVSGCVLIIFERALAKKGVLTTS